MESTRIHPRITQYARQISSKAKYPITNFGQLVEALGGSDARIQFDGPRMLAKELKQVIPDRFFPIKSEEDLVKKSEQLRARYMK